MQSKLQKCNKRNLETMLLKTPEIHFLLCLTQAYDARAYDARASSASAWRWLS